MKRFFKIILIFAIILFGISQTSIASADPAPGGPFRSSLRLQNMGSSEAWVIVEFYNSSGAIVDTTPSQTVQPNDVINIVIPSGMASGEYSAVVSSDQPLAAVSSFSDSDSGAAYNGFSQGAPEWYIPGLYDNYYGYYSNVYAQNVSGAQADIKLEIYAPGSSTPIYSNTKTNVPSNASVKWDQKDLSELATNVFYAAKVSSASDIIAIANIYGSGETSQQLYSYSGYSTGGKEWYTPVVLNNYYGWNASLIIQNVSNSTANVTVEYSPGYSTSYSIPAWSVKSIYIPHEPLPSGRNGLFGAKITSNVNVVAMINQSNTYNRAATYNSFLNGGTKVYAPGVYKRASDFSSSITCQNIGNNPTRMKITYKGQPTAGSTSGNIPVGGTHIWYQPNDPLPNGYDGSAVIESLDGENIACIVNRNTEDEPLFSKSWDMFFSANAANQ